MKCLEPDCLLHHLLGDPELRIGRGCSVVLGLLFLSFTACGADPERATVSLIWDPVNDSSVVGYYIHYGKQSADQPGSCAYDEMQFASSPKGTVTGLDPGSIYYFAVSAYNGVEGNCSNEVFAHT
ncbi:MAG: fibronectin type III domain-containing protein [Nitrospira sp.]|nr:fibronectin type III domain-containing protein [Nitrospira sp.]